MTMTDEHRTGDELAEAGLDPPKERSKDVELAPSRSSEIEISQWESIRAQAETISSTSVVPALYRGKPDEILAAYLTGREFGWGMMASLRYIWISQDGKPSFSAEAILGMIRQRGHSVTGSSTRTGATITGKRRDNGDEMTVEYTIEDALAEGLVQKIENGRPIARSSQGKRMPWEKFPQHMCWARCVTTIGRRLFPEVVLGISYVPDEFDGPAFVDPVNDEHTAAASGPRETPAEVRTADIIRDRYGLLPTEAREAIDRWLESGDAPTIEAMSNNDHPEWLAKVAGVVDKAIVKYKIEPFDVDSDASPQVEDVPAGDVEIVDTPTAPPVPVDDDAEEATVVDVAAIESSIDDKVAAAKAKQAKQADKAEDESIRAEFEESS